MDNYPKPRFSKSEKDFLEMKGFTFVSEKMCQLISEDLPMKTFLVALQNGSYKLEFYESCDDGDGNYYEDFDKEYSKKRQSLEDFVNFWISP